VSEAEAAFGPVTVLHNNAAHKSPEVMRGDGNILDVDLDLWDAVQAVNLRGAVLGCRRVLPGMLDRGKGVIIMTSSVTADHGGTARVAYSVSKAGLQALVRHVATAFGKQGIRCNAVSPGIVITPTNAKIIGPEQLAMSEKDHLTPRLGRPEDVAGLVTFLASDQAAFITGHTIPVDGGLTAHLPALSG
jgi:NAD(P)-dependent dehydrogenase (short-subunit alcohol dehydrogenase family)